MHFALGEGDLWPVPVGFRSLRAPAPSGCYATTQARRSLPVQPAGSQRYRGDGGALCGRALAQVAGERCDAGGLAVPCEHEAGCAADEGVEAPAALPQPVEDFFRCQKKDRIRFNGLREADAGSSGDLFRELARAAVGVLGVAQPRAALEHPYPWR